MSTATQQTPAAPAAAPTLERMPEWMRSVERTERHLLAIAPMNWPACLHLVHQHLWRAMNTGASVEEVRHLLRIVDRVTAKLRVKLSDLVEKHVQMIENMERKDRR